MKSIVRGFSFSNHMHGVLTHRQYTDIYYINYTVLNVLMTIIICLMITDIIITKIISII